VISGISVIIGSIDQPWGVLGCHAKVRRDFSENDIRFIRILANTLSLAIERKRAEEALQESEKNFRNLADSDFNALVVHRNFHLLYANVAAQRIFEAVSPEHKLGESVLDYVHPRFRNFARLSVNRVLRRNEAIPPVAIKAVTPSGKVLDIEIVSTPVHFDGSPAVLSIVHDITERKQAESLIKRTADVLEMVATGQPASDIYDAIARMYEKRHPGMRCSMLVLKGNQLMHGGAPSLPAEYCNAVKGLKNGPDVGSCGTSTYTGKRVLVEDIATDPKWADLKSVALPHGLRCCWSEPIKSVGGEVLGAFSMHYNHPALPDERELSDLE